MQSGISQEALRQILTKAMNLPGLAGPAALRSATMTAMEVAILGGLLPIQAEAAARKH